MFGLIIASAIAASAQNNITFTATADQTTVALNDYVAISFTLCNTEPSSFVPPPFNDFKIAGGPNQSTEMSVINGAVTRTFVYAYFLSPKTVGRFTIGAATVMSRGKKYQTKPIVLQVVGNNSAARNAKPGNSSSNGFTFPNGGQGTYGAAPKTNKSKILTDAQLAKGIFLKAEPAKREVYVGEQLTVEFKLYTRYPLSGKQFTGLPALKGFFPVEFKQFDSNTRRESIGGTTYAVQTLRKVALYPQKNGNLVIDPMRVQVGVIQDSDPLEDPFGMPIIRPFEVESPTVTIQVKALPLDAPKSFGGAVGAYTMQVAASPLALTTDDAVKLELTLTGNGDLKRVVLPNLGIDSTQFEAYDPKISDRTEETPTDIQLQKKYEYVLLPHQTGVLHIAPTFSYFDTQTQQYKVLTPKVVDVTVTLGKKPLTAMRKRDERGSLLPNKPKGVLRPNKTTLTLAAAPASLLGSRLFWVLFCLPWAAIIGIVGYKRLQTAQKNIDRHFLRRKRAGTTAAKRLAKAKTLLKQADNSPFYNEVQKAIWQYAADKFGILPANLSKDYLREHLLTQGVSPDTLAQLFALLQRCEIATFATQTDTPQQRDTVYRAAAQMIGALEQATNRVG